MARHTRARLFLLTVALLLMSMVGLTAFPSSAQMDYEDTILADNPDRYYRLGESSGTTAADIAGTADNATIGGSPTYSQAGVPSYDSNTAIKQSGGSPGILITQPTYTLSASYYFEAWIKLEAANTSHFVYVFRTINFNGDRNLYCYLLSTGTPLGWQSRLETTGSGGASFTYTTPLSANFWHHFVCGYDAATGKTRLYINGAVVLDQTMTQITGTGTIYNAYNFSANATIDEIAVYSTALSAAQVLAHYEAGIETGPPPTSTITPSPTPDVRVIATLPGSGRIYAMDLTFSAGDITIVVFLVIIACLLVLQAIFGVVQWLRR